MYQRPTLVPEFNPYTDCPPEEYFQHHSSLGKIALGQQLAAFAESVLGRPGSMLELGCGRGELLRGAANRGWSVRGVEMTEAFARIASEEHGLEVERAPPRVRTASESPMTSFFWPRSWSICMTLRKRSSA